MATDYLSALNVGSGLNTTEIIDALVAAEREPRETVILAAQEKRNSSVSALGQIKTNFASFKNSLDLIQSASGLSTIQSGSNVGISITDSSLVSSFTHTLEVDNLASSQTLVFPGFTSKSQSLGAGSIDFSFGSWSGEVFNEDTSHPTQTIDISSASDTVQDIKDAINSANIGLTASLIDVGDGFFSLIIKTETGADNAVSISVSEDAPGSGLANLSYTEYDADKEVETASNASFTIDGTSVTRSRNEIVDLFDGVQISLNNITTSPEIIGTKWDNDLAFASLEVLVEQINSLNSTLGEMTKRGAGEGEDGALAGSALARNIQNKLRSITTDPINGYTESPIYLTNFGLATQRDGTVTLDREKFDNTFEADPSLFAAIVSDKISTSELGVEASVYSSNWVPGNYTLEVDDNGTVSVDGNNLYLSSSIYRSNSGNTNGLMLDIEDGITSATIFMGRSLVSQLNLYTENLLKSQSDIETQISSYNKELSQYDLEMSSLNERMEAIKQRYISQFSAMETLVASFKKTEQGLTNMMDSWRAMMKD